MIKIPKRLNLPCCNIPSLDEDRGKKKKNRKFSRALPYSELLSTKSAGNRLFFSPPKQCVTISLVLLCLKR